MKNSGRFTKIAALELVAFALMAASSSAFAQSHKGLTFQGFLKNSNGDLVTASNLTITSQLLSPNDCVLVEETHSGVNIVDGFFTVVLGKGTRTGADKGFSLKEAFSNSTNRTGLDPSASCNYTPTSADARKLKLNFVVGADTIAADFNIRANAYSVWSEAAEDASKFNGKAADQYIQVNSGTGLTQARLEEFVTSSTSTSGGAVKWNGTNFVAYNPADGSNLSNNSIAGSAIVSLPFTKLTSVPTPLSQIGALNCTNGQILQISSGSWACTTLAGGGSVTNVTSANSYLTVTSGASTPVLTVNVGTGANTVAAGNDSRLTDSRAPNGAATGDLNGSYPNPTVKAIRGFAVNATTPVDGQVYKWVNASSEFQAKYVGIADLKKSDGSSQMPATCAANETLSWSSISDVLTCAAIGSLDASKITTGTLSASRLPADTVVLTCADGKIAKRVAGAWACADESVGSETDPSVQAYAKVAPGTGLKVTSGEIVPDFGTTAGKVVEGNDSRLSDARVASDINGVAATGIIQRTGAGAFTALGTAAPVSVSGGNIGLAVGTGLTLSSGSLVPDFGTAAGKVAQGNDSRFPSSACASGKSRWDGSAWQCEAVTDTSKVAKAGDTMTGTLNLPSNGLVVGTTQLVVSGGSVGVGTASPAVPLDVSGMARVLASVEGAAASVSSGASMTISDLSRNIRRITLDSNTTITLPDVSSLPSNAAYSLTVRVKQDATGSRTLTWAGNTGQSIKWDTGSAPTIASSANQETIYQFFIIGGETVWYGSMVWREN